MKKTYLDNSLKKVDRWYSTTTKPDTMWHTGRPPMCPHTAQNWTLLDTNGQKVGIYHAE